MILILRPFHLPVLPPCFLNMQTLPLQQYTLAPPPQLFQHVAMFLPLLCRVDKTKSEQAHCPDTLVFMRCVPLLFGPDHSLGCGPLVKQLKGRVQNLVFHLPAKRFSPAIINNVLYAILPVSEQFHQVDTELNLDFKLAFCGFTGSYV